MAVQNQKEIRDRFIAFAFAASDFLMEISKEGEILFVAGQVQTLTGCSSETLKGKNWLSYFTEESHGNLGALLKGVQRAGRLGPLMVNIINHETNKTNRALVMGMTMPDSDHVYLTFNATQSFFDFLAVGDHKDSKLLDGKQFEAAAIKAFQDAKQKGKELEVTFLDADQINQYKKGLSIEEANNFAENFNSVLKEQSFHGNAASQVDDDKYALIHEAEITSEFIERKIQELVKRSGNETTNLDLKSKTVNANLDTLNEREARRALIYTINQVEKKGLDAAGDDLAKGFDEYLDENAAKITRLKALVGQQGFKLNFQPVVFIPSEQLCHYEALVRFETDKSPYELIVFGEDIGIAPDIDMAILKQAIGIVEAKRKEDPSIRVAVNISGQSIQSEQFFDKMIELLDEMKVSSDNLLFEITESTAIGDLEKVNNSLQRLRRKKFEVCLDDFGAGAASFQYLNGLDIDCVKIDGKYIRDALNSARDEAMVRNLARMCQDLRVTTIAEMVETQEQLDYLVKIGVDKGQGWIFGKPQQYPDYVPRQK
jgi:EAL domain-containing protein (putative c-di-GMP-specific phosphodiesterase class I)